MCYSIDKMVHTFWSVNGNKNIMHGMYKLKVFCLGCYMFRLFYKIIIRHMHKNIRESKQPVRFN
jgi:hypothetical protein